MTIRRILRELVAVAIVLLSAISGAATDDAKQTSAGPVQVVVWTAGTWIEVEMVEDRDGSVVYRKPGGVPTAATAHSVDTDTTWEVNGALADLSDACNGRTADPRSMFELVGRSREIFFLVADTHHGECLRRMHQQYQRTLSGPQAPPDTGELSSYAVDRNLNTGSDGGVVLDNTAVGSTAGAPFTDYRAVLDRFERTVTDVENNIRAALDRKVLFQDAAWMKQNTATLGALDLACDTVRQLSPPPAGKAFHALVVSTVDEIAAINAQVRKGFETGAVTLLYDALPEIDSTMLRFDERRAKVYETYRPRAEVSPVFKIPDLYGNPDELITAKCRAEWPEDPNMEARCVEEQKKAVKRMRTRSNRSVGVWSYVFDDIREECRLEWPSDFAMRDSCEQTRFKTHITIHGKKEW